jgi:hypothetical protein
VYDTPAIPPKAPAATLNAGTNAGLKRTAIDSTSVEKESVPDARIKAIRVEDISPESSLLIA